MTRLDYRNICEEVSNGEGRMLENAKTHDVGKILSCHSEYFNVEVGEGWRVWSRDECEETAEGN